MVAAFVAVPSVIFALPALAGVPWLVDDNLIQNFPLRVLVGVDLRHGHAPVWDPYLWSGSPLLSGFNAGAAYPATWLFTVLPGALAWVVNQALVEVVAALGMVVLLRVLGRSWTASGLGAVAFAYGGFMAAQNVHIDLVEAGAWLPWAFAGLDRLAHRPRGRSATPWVAMLGASIGLMGLSGAAEPILDGGVALTVYALWLFWKTPTRRLSLALGVAAGVALGLALAGAQLVPGALIQEQSQRAIHDYAFFTSGSMNKSLTVLGLDPLVLGTSGAFPLHFFATYSLPEVSSYVGIMPLMGVFGLLARRHRRNPESSRWWVWYAILALGLVLTWGDFTPLGHVFFHLPLFNRQRLLSRNLLEVDLAIAVLFAAWVDHMLLSPLSDVGPSPDVVAEAAPPSAPTPERSTGRWWRTLPGPAGWHSDVVLPLIPPGAVIGLQIVLLAGGTWFPHFLHVPGHVTRSSLWPLIAFLTIPSALAAWASWLLLRRRRLRARLPRLLTVLLIVDLLLFNGFTQGSADPQGATDDSATANALASFVAAQGQGPAGEEHRVALFDPDRYYSVATERIGQPDLTILRNLSSVQGYGAVVDANYDRATNTHGQLEMKPSALADGTFAQLDLGVLATVPEYFEHVVVAPPDAPVSVVTGATRIPPVGPQPGAPPDTTPPPPTSPSNYQIRAAAGDDGVAPVGPVPDPVLRHGAVGDLGLDPGADGLGVSAGGPVGARRQLDDLDRLGLGPARIGPGVGARSQTVQWRRPRGRPRFLRPGRHRCRDPAHRRAGHVPHRRVATRCGDAGAVALPRHDRALQYLHAGLGVGPRLGAGPGPRRPRRDSTRGLDHAVGRRDHSRHHRASRHAGAFRAVRHGVAGHGHDRGGPRWGREPSGRLGATSRIDPGRARPGRDVARPLHLPAPPSPRGIRGLGGRLHRDGRPRGMARCSASS